jgi:hypothetical protein
MPGLGYTVDGIPSSTPSGVVSGAIDIAEDGCKDITSVLSDITDNTLSDASGSVCEKYGVDLPGAGLNINTAAGAMVVDDLMQKISTKVQVAAQLLSAVNNMSKTVGRTLSQG